MGQSTRPAMMKHGKFTLMTALVMWAFAAGVQLAGWSLGPMATPGRDVPWTALGPWLAADLALAVLLSWLLVRVLTGRIRREMALASHALSKDNRVLMSLACRDSLTGLYNMAYFRERLKERVLLSVVEQSPLSLLMLDLDRFKQCNDTLGHPFGDRVLKDIAAILGENTRSSDVVARYGGDEFAIILPETGIQNAGLVAERIRAAVEQYAQRSLSQQLPEAVGISIGVATFERGTTSADDLLKAADQALYRAKSARNRVEITVLREAGAEAAL
ncbi:MAG: GGDEF domain-containing protein [Syntrophomonadaceae bacterium]|nr:GGDEF domain-containing protein [Syntrophomonadaceae bacterium]